MPGPWDKYATQEVSGSGPWSKYSDEPNSEGQPPLPEKASSFLSTLAQKAKGMFGMGAVKAATDPITRPLEAGADIIKQNPEGALEAIPAIAATGAGIATWGVGAIPSILAAGGAGAGGRVLAQEGRRAMGLDPVSPQQPTIPFTTKEIPDIPGIPKTVSRPIIEGALQAGPEALGRGISPLSRVIGKGLERAGISGARRTQGFRQSDLVSNKSPFETIRMRGKASAAAKESLERGDISLTGNAYTMEKNTMKAFTEGNTQVNNAIKAANVSGKTLNQADVDNVLAKVLNPKNEDELAAALKIERELSDISEKGAVTIEALNDLRSSFGQTGFRDKTVGSAAAEMYRKAWSATGEEIQRLLGDVDPKVAATYKEGLRKESNALTSLRSIEKQIGRIEGNEFVSLPGLLTQTVRRGMAPLSIGGFRGGRALQAGADAVGEGSKALPRLTAGIGGEQRADGKKTPSFLESLRVAAKRSASQAGDILSAPTQKASAAMAPSLRDFSRIMAEGSPQSKSEIEADIRRKFPVIAKAAAQKGRSIRRFLQDYFTEGGSDETLDEIAREVNASLQKRYRKR